VLDEVVMRGKSVLTSDAQHDPRFASGTVVLQGVRSVLAVPLGVADKVFGIIYADSPIAEGRFTEDHLKVLTTLASVAAIRVENARLVEERLERERLERELALASENPTALSANSTANRPAATNSRALASHVTKSAAITTTSLNETMED
jgi:GAF domain-containing protein